MTSARLQAYRILHRVETGRAYAANLLASHQLDSLSGEDRALTYELVLGVLRWQLQLDYFIQRYARRPVNKLDLPVVLALRLGLYQIRFLERIPLWAAVNESVQLVKRHGVGSAGGFVNAILREASRRRQDIAGEDVKEDSERLSIEHSHPRWTVEKWVRQFGRDEAVALMQANNTPPRTALRFNPLKGDPTTIRAQLEAEGMSLAPSRYVPGAYAVTQGSLSNHASPVRDGRVYIQDEGSQLIGTLLDAKPDLRVLDLCAAPGGKTSQIASEMNDAGLIIAGDFYLHRVRVLQQTCRRLGVTLAHFIVWDGTAPLPLSPHERFERVLVDAPCSGTGTIRHHPEIKWRLRPDPFEALPETQLRLLESAAPFVAPGGKLVYSTCSLEPEENEAVVDRFLAETPLLQLSTSPVDDALRTPEGFIRTYPHQHGMDGFFAAVFTRHA